MDDRVTRSILKRLDRLERQSVRLRRGVVTDTGPLDVALGGSDTSYEDVPALSGLTLNVNDNVVVLVSGHQLLVVGVL